MMGMAEYRFKEQLPACCPAGDQSICSLSVDDVDTER